MVGLINCFELATLYFKILDQCIYIYIYIYILWAFFFLFKRAYDFVKGARVILFGKNC